MLSAFTFYGATMSDRQIEIEASYDFFLSMAVTCLGVMLVLALI